MSLTPEQLRDAKMESLRRVDVTIKKFGRTPEARQQIALDVNYYVQMLTLDFMEELAARYPEDFPSQQLGEMN